MKYNKLFLFCLAVLSFSSCEKEFDLDEYMPESAKQFVVVSREGRNVSTGNTSLSMGNTLDLSAEWNFDLNGYVQWSASNSNVSLNPNGSNCAVRAVSAGPVSITAQVGSYSASYSLTVLDLTPRFSAVCNGNYKGEFTILNDYNEYDSFKWDFGDGYTNTTYRGVIHTYSYSGWYTVKLTLYKGNISKTTSKDIYIYY